MIFGRQYKSHLETSTPSTASTSSCLRVPLPSWPADQRRYSGHWVNAGCPWRALEHLWIRPSSVPTRNKCSLKALKSKHRPAQGAWARPVLSRAARANDSTRDAQPGVQPSDTCGNAGHVSRTSATQTSLAQHGSTFRQLCVQTAVTGSTMTKGAHIEAAQQV